MDLNYFKKTPMALGRNEAYGLRHMHNKGWSGSGVTIGLIDDFDVNHGHNTKSNIIHKYINNQIFGTAPNGNVIVYDLPKYHNLIDVARAIDECIVDDVDIISLSISGTGNFEMLREVVRKAYDNNILIVCSAGNTGENWNDDTSITRYPAAYEETVAVGSIDNKMNWSTFESHSYNIDLVGWGENVVVQNENGAYTLSSGTSFSTPAIAGMFACVISMFRDKGQKYNVELLKQYVYERCVDLGKLGNDMYYGNGFPTMNINDFKQVRRDLGLSKVIKMVIDDLDYEVNGETKLMDVPPMIHGNRALVPIRFVAEALGCDVEWDADTRTITIKE